MTNDEKTDGMEAILEDLKAFYWDIMCEFYGEHPQDFVKDYYWEFLIVD